MDGKTHPMTENEMAKRLEAEEDGAKGELLDSYLSKSVNTHAAWSNREDDLYFSGKRLLFASKADDITDQWIDKLSQMVTEEIV
jgi:hypothetical protein